MNKSTFGILAAVILVIGVYVLNEGADAPTGSGDPASTATIVGSDEEIQKHFLAKLQNPDYISRKNAPGIPDGVQDFPEEQRIKEARARLAHTVTPPAGAKILSVPVVAESALAIDGKISAGEWDQALKLSFGTGEAKAAAFFLSDGKHLFVACDAPTEKTQTGFDQLRIFLHLGISKVIVNERLHVGVGTSRAIRATNIQWQGAPPEGENEKWKQQPISDWNIYKHARAATSFDGNRQYEASIDLEEAGLRSGVAFPLYLELETDPLKDEAGKFKSRQYIGTLGAQDAPIWFSLGE